jgi:trigger factor
LVAAPDLGSGAERRGGSSPFIRTFFIEYNPINIMSTQFDYVDELNATLTVELLPDDYMPKVNESIEKLKKKSNIPGFRTGKAPIGLIRKHYLKSVILDEVNKISDKKLQNFINEKSVTMIGYPLINNELTPVVEDVHEQMTFKLVFDIGIVKDFQLNINKEFVEQYKKVYVNDNILDNEISILQKQHAEFGTADNVNEECMVSGLLILHRKNETDDDNSSEKKQKFFFIEKLQSNPSLYNKFIGAAKNELLLITKEEIENMKDLEFLISDDIDFENIEITYEITDIYTSKAAELNESFFKKVFPNTDIDNEEDFRNELRNEIQLQYDKQSDILFLRNATDQLVQKVDIELSETFLKRFLIDNNKDNEEFINDIESNFEKYLKSVKYQYIESKIFETFEIKIELDDYKNHIRNFYKEALKRTDVPDEQITLDLKQLMNDKKQREQLDEDVKNSKLIQVFKDNISITEVTYDSFKDLINEANKQYDSENKHIHSESCNHDDEDHVHGPDCNHQH